MTLHPDTTDPRALRMFKVLPERLLAVHGTTYTYDNLVYRNTTTLVTIACAIHGDFKQTLSNHLSGKGCLKCSGRAQLTTEEFIQAATRVHGDTYTYEDADYINGTTKLVVGCKLHGNFETNPNNFVSKGFGCPECGILKNVLAQTDTTESFIAKAVAVHGDKYDYSLTNYVKAVINVDIVCKIHGVFSQRPQVHTVNGCGCPSCAVGGFASNKPGTLYYLSVNNGQAYKIGITNRTVEERFGSDMQYIEVIQTWHYDNGQEARDRETEILREYKYSQYLGEPLLKSGNTELFTHDILNLHKELT